MLASIRRIQTKACISKLAILGLAFFFTNYDLGYEDMILLGYQAQALNLSPDNSNLSTRRDSKTKNWKVSITE